MDLTIKNCGNVHDNESEMESTSETRNTVPNKVNTLDIENVAKIVQVFECKMCDFIHRSYDVLLDHYKTHTETSATNIDSVCDGEYEKEEVLVDTHRNVKVRETRARNKKLGQSNQINKNNSGKIQNGQNKEVIASDDDDYEGDDGDTEISPLPFKEFKLLIKENLTQKCPMKSCSFKFETKEKLESHIKCHLSSDVEKVREFKCLNCSIEIKSWHNCTWHMWKSHQIDIDMLKCLVCTYKSVTAVRVWRHMRVHEKWRSKVLKTLKRSNLKQRKDPELSRWYSPKTCEICTRKFSNSKTLSKHVKAVHNKIKPFICNVCGSKSARKSTWIIHMRQHTGEKPLQCKSCPFKASDPSVLKKHELRHNKITQYSCNSCDYKSIQSITLKQHVKSLHPEDYKKLCCDQCSYVSVSINYLEAHKNDHKKGLIVNEDSSDNINNTSMKMLAKTQHPSKPTTNVEISSDCFLPLDSTDSIAHDPSLDTGGVTIPAHSEDTQFPN